MPLLSPAFLAIEQIDDRVFLGVVLRSVLWSALGFAALTIALFWGLHDMLAGHGWLAWLAAAGGAIGSALLALVLFVPIASGIASLFSERIAAAVEQIYYPGLPPQRPASVTAQTLDALSLGLRVLVMQGVALVATLLVPGFGAVFGWFVSSWAVGRGLFVAVAMLRMDRAHATALYRANRTAVLAQGALITAAGMVPVLNILAPILGVAAMVHVLHRGHPAAAAVVGRT
jgi:CysZ protein